MSELPSQLYARLPEPPRWWRRKWRSDPIKGRVQWAIDNDIVTHNEAWMWIRLDADYMLNVWLPEQKA
jgi:hypothetical protein